MSEQPGDAAEQLRRSLLAFAPRLAHLMRHELGRLDPSLTYRQYRVLLHVDEGATSLTALRGLTTVALSTLSEVVDSLVQRGLVTRAPSPRDRRGIALALTAEGAKALAAARRTLDELADHVLEGVAPTRRRDLERALATMDTAVRDLLVSGPRP